LGCFVFCVQRQELMCCCHVRRSSCKWSSHIATVALVVVVVAVGKLAAKSESWGSLRTLEILEKSGGKRVSALSIIEWLLQACILIYLYPFGWIWRSPACSQIWVLGEAAALAPLKSWGKRVSALSIIEQLLQVCIYLVYTHLGGSESPSLGFCFTDARHRSVQVENPTVAVVMTKNW
jgi:hypothetical protein